MSAFTKDIENKAGSPRVKKCIAFVPWLYNVTFKVKFFISHAKYICMKLSLTVGSGFCCKYI
jgi:hypothetical protein